MSRIAWVCCTLVAIAPILNPQQVCGQKAAPPAPISPEEPQPTPSNVPADPGDPASDVEVIPELEGEPKDPSANLAVENPTVVKEQLDPATSANPVLATEVAAEDSGEDPDEGALFRPEYQLCSYHLKYADAASVAKLLTEQFPSVTPYSVDPTTSTVYGRVTKAVNREIEELIAQLEDRAAQRQERVRAEERQRVVEQQSLDLQLLSSNQLPEKQLLAYYLKYADAAELFSILEDLGFKGQGLQYSIDARTNSIIVMGTPESQEQFATLVKVLDQPASSNAKTTTDTKNYQSDLEKLLRSEHQRLSELYGPKHPLAVQFLQSIEGTKTEVSGSVQQAMTGSASGAAQQVSQQLMSLQRAYELAEQRAAEAAARFRQEQSQPRQSAARLKSLRDQVLQETQRAFELRQALQKQRIERSRRELEVIQQRLMRRAELADRIIDRRVSELIDGDELSWSSSDAERVFPATIIHRNDSTRSSTRGTPVTTEVEAMNETMTEVIDPNRDPVRNGTGTRIQPGHTVTIKTLGEGRILIQGSREGVERIEELLRREDSGASKALEPPDESAGPKKPVDAAADSLIDEPLIQKPRTELPRFEDPDTTAPVDSKPEEAQAAQPGASSSTAAGKPDREEQELNLLRGVWQLDSPAVDEQTGLGEQSLDSEILDPDFASPSSSMRLVFAGRLMAVFDGTRVRATYQVRLRPLARSGTIFLKDVAGRQSLHGAYDFHEARLRMSVVPVSVPLPDGILPEHVKFQRQDKQIPEELLMAFAREPKVASQDADLAAQLRHAGYMEQAAEITDSDLLLQAAADRYELLYQRYRSQLGGTYARAKQAQLLEKLGDEKQAELIRSGLRESEAGQIILKDLQRLQDQSN